MSKSIASYPADQRVAVIRRRLSANTRGIGYWAAVQAAQRLGISINKPTKAEKQSGKDASNDARVRARHKKVLEQNQKKGVSKHGRR